MRRLPPVMLVGVGERLLVAAVASGVLWLLFAWAVS